MKYGKTRSWIFDMSNWSLQLHTQEFTIDFLQKIPFHQVGVVISATRKLLLLDPEIIVIAGPTNSIQYSGWGFPDFVDIFRRDPYLNTLHFRLLGSFCWVTSHLKEGKFRGYDQLHPEESFSKGLFAPNDSPSHRQGYRGPPNNFPCEGLVHPG